MKKILHIIIISIFSLTVISCAKKDESTSSSSSSGTTTDNTTTLSAPSGVSAKLGYYQVAVDWTAVSGASSYTVYWGSSTGITSSSTAITGITDDNYTHSSLDNGTKYYYRVATVNSAGTGSLSSEVNAIPRDATTVTEGCTGKETASGTVQGVTRTGPSGTFYHSWYGASPSNGCINNSSAISAFSTMVPSASNSVKHALVITGDGYGFTDTWHFYSDTACAVETGFVSSSYGPPLATSDNITIASPPDGYPSVATKVTYENNYKCFLAETDAVVTKFKSLFGSIPLTKGTVYDEAKGTDKKTVLWTVLDNISGQTINWFYTEDNEIANTYPDNFTDPGGATAWHAGDNITR
jgi:hypothetical protein